MSEQPTAPTWRVCTNAGSWEEVRATHVVTEDTGWARFYVGGDLVAAFFHPDFLARK